MIPVYAQNHASPDAAVDTPEVEVPFDDGDTWQQVESPESEDGWAAGVDQPVDAKFVSRRGGASDAEGSGEPDHPQGVRASAAPVGVASCGPGRVPVGAHDRGANRDQR
ncbi:hypothetical protein OG946_24790 [Streptomyces sp. NBC_01808]|uniref:hypothetical protein n=1 Tax=Streptomyces sp. NBC_01808 TaxID=2975947 RepID=UPI002DDADC04|nr:hypothetical protein [Streptomyces sp. NBC_01808]WSA40300.1 hypothetical protein OG946_24790 [Streptomyces sp. NBC_01808]